MDLNYVKQQSEAIFSDMVAARRHLHANPELGGMEYETQKYIMDFLGREGIQCQKCADTGVLAVVDSGRPGKVVALRGDIDALPLPEEKSCGYRSRNSGIMHACGHDAHTAINLGCVKFFNDNRQKFNGTMKFFFQPSEETDGGAERMMRDGCLENPTVDCVLGLHVYPFLEYNQVEVKRGAICASVDAAHITIRGKGGHGAYPAECVDAIAIAAQAVSAAQTLVSREISPLDNAVFTVGAIHGGTVPNIIAREVKLAATLRSSGPEVRAKIHRRVREIFTGIAETMGGSAEVNIVDGYPAVVNHDEVIKIVEDEAAKYLGAENIFHKKNISMGGEDFSFFIQDTPGAFYNVGCKSPGAPDYALHINTFDIDERCLKTGFVTQIMSALRILNGE